MNITIATILFMSKDDFNHLIYCILSWFIGGLINTFVQIINPYANYFESN
jgi:hypothetical protein